MLLWFFLLHFAPLVASFFNWTNPTPQITDFPPAPLFSVDDLLDVAWSTDLGNYFIFVYRFSEDGVGAEFMSIYSMYFSFLLCLFLAITPRWDYRIFFLIITSLPNYPTFKYGYDI